MTRDLFQQGDHLMIAGTGAQLLSGLRDHREVWPGGRRVSDPVEHAALRRGAQAIAGIYDLRYQYPADCLMPDRVAN